jgi:GTP-binding protein HflX
MVVDVVLPYDRGDLVSRVHELGEVLEEQHNEAGTRLRARVSEALAGELASYAASPA